jgi:DNA gyrase subunit B
MAGADLRNLVEEARVARGLLRDISKHVPLKIIEQAAILGALNPQVLTDPAHAGEIGGYLAKRLDALEDPLERGWTGTVLEDGGLQVSRTLRGVSNAYVIDNALIKSSEARRLDAMAGSLQKSYMKHGVLTAKDKDHPITGPVDLIERITEMGRKGLAVQRYKGLGEMNPSQLWETTLDPNVRILLQVKVEHSEAAGEVFSTLMGDNVEPRRDFIQENALKVSNLDV